MRLIKFLIFLCMVVILCLAAIIQYNYVLSKDIKNAIFINKFSLKINETPLFTLKIEDHKQTIDYENMSISLSENKLIIKKYENDNNSCDLIDNIYIVKNNDTTYSLFILNNSELNFNYYYNNFVRFAPCYKNLEFDLSELLKSGDLLYVVNKNEVIKELRVP